MLGSLFLTFFKMGLISFGGGYAMLPVIQREVQAHGWMSEGEFTNTIAIAGMGPGPIATNSASLIGYHVAGIPGAIASTGGMIMPSLLIIISFAAFFYKVNHQLWVRSSFYGLRPVIAALIAYAAIHFIISVADGDYGSWLTLATLGIAAAGIFAIVRYRVSPFLIIVASGLLGIVLF
jgi:chromate transporter